MSEADRGPKTGLDQISTRWPLINDPVQFILRYARAIQGYLGVLIKNPQDAEEVKQDFLTRVVQHGFVEERVVRGRFRDYLIAAVRNAARSHLRRRQLPRQAGVPLEELAAPAAEEEEADREWLARWRRCVLESVWEALDDHQRRSPGNLFYTVLRVVVDHPGEDSPALAARAGALTGRPLRAAAFRKQVSRARRLFAELLVQEVRKTLEDPDPLAVEEELIEVGLMKYVRPFLPADWRTRGQLTDPE
jgi:hypothetical protein